ncbi:aconitate hydratase AcnA [Photobacterium lutimaris]|uniref:Aconitate hydratase n=1 Tax=Photobacterium lutimaris TaxID=388278 RepID=A0A2T3J4Q9_9GAMM|nr:aconitate hydratase AcnA [Photobacterium lutimaris]PSU36264.1 aconitate hydratase AcnA [Photobacterium lutimaris]TDR74855.1 aconitase [Photobacterium lutimaris]
MIPDNEHAWRQRYLQSLTLNGKEYAYWSLKMLANDYQIDLSHLPLVTRLFLENVMRHYDDHATTSAIVSALCAKNNNADDDIELSFYPSRVLMQDYTGVPALVDLAAMRDAIFQAGGDPQKINPMCDVDLVIDHSVIADKAGQHSALNINRQQEMRRNQERYQFLKWAQSAFDNLTVIPPGRGICHQVNLEYLAQVVRDEQGVLIPDSLVGTDSHTTMINGLGVLGWGVGGIEAEAAMLGQPVSLNLPHIVGVQLEGKLKEGITATDLVLTITERLRAYGVVGKYVEFYGSGVLNLTVADRATLSNMAPEYGANCGIFPVDEKVIAYLQLTNRPLSLIERVRAYAMAQGLWYDTDTLSPNYAETVHIDLSVIEASMAGPKRPQDRLALSAIKHVTQAHIELMGQKVTDDKCRGESPHTLTNGDVVIAAITSCTNTSNPTVMLTAGLLAKAAVEKGLSVPSYVKTSLAPGSQAVARYLDDTGLQVYLDGLGFQRIGFGCTTCIGNSGPLNGELEADIEQQQLSVCAVLSGNRNFEGRIHPAVSLNWLASPPLVIAFALVGHTRIDLQKDPIATNDEGEDIYLRDLWPTDAMIDHALRQVTQHQFRLSYKDIEKGDNHWQSLTMKNSICYPWDPASTYIQRPPFFERESNHKPVQSARILAILGDSITTDHISPAGQIAAQSPAGLYLRSHHVSQADFNSYGARRGNHEVMVRGTFANRRIQNKMVIPEIGGVTRYYGSIDSHHGDGLPIAELPSVITVYDASQQAIADDIPLVVFAGKEYGTGSSRDWAAKGCLLQNVKAVIAESFERIHRSNLVGMGVLPLQIASQDRGSVQLLSGRESVSIALKHELHPRQDINIVLRDIDGSTLQISAILRIDNQRELDYFNAGGVLRYIANRFI